MCRVLLTGSSGFIGPTVARRLIESGHEVFAAGRTPPPADANLARWIRVADQHASTDWREALVDVEVVVHLAGHAHAASNTEESRRLIHSVNVDGTEQLGRCAAAARVRRFIFLSSIKVHGEETGAKPFSPGDLLRPADPYGDSKALAESCLKALATDSGMELVVIRPPLVIGSRSKANLARLEQLVRSALPLPFGSIHNTRSLLSIDNLADLIALCVEHPRATVAPLLAADADAPSTPQLIHWIANAMGRPARLFPCPPGVLEALARPLGLGKMMRRLTRSLAVDTSATTALTGWMPARTTLDTLRAAYSGLRPA